jgi:hypothetical protein
LFNLDCLRRFAETVSTIVPLLGPLSKDSEPVVKQHFVEQLRYLAKVRPIELRSASSSPYLLNLDVRCGIQFCNEAGGEEGYKVVLEQILPITAAMLEDEKLEVGDPCFCTKVSVGLSLTAADAVCGRCGSQRA